MLHVGDQVLAYNTATGKTQAKTVQHVFINHDTNLLDVTIAPLKQIAPHLMPAARGPRRPRRWRPTTRHGLRRAHWARRRRCIPPLSTRSSRRIAASSRRRRCGSANRCCATMVARAWSRRCGCCPARRCGIISPCRTCTPIWSGATGGWYIIQVAN